MDNIGEPIKEIETQVDVEVPPVTSALTSASAPIPPASAPPTFACTAASDDSENAITSTVIEKPKKPRTQKQKDSLQKAQKVRQEKIRMRLEKDDKQQESRLKEYSELKDTVKAQQIELQRIKGAQEPKEVEEAEEIEKKPRKRRTDKKTQESKVEDVVSKMTKVQYMRMLGF